MVILKGISKDVPADDLTKIIRQENEEINEIISDDGEGLKLRFKRDNKNNNLYNVVLLVDPKVYSKMLTMDRISIDYQRVHVASFSPFFQCHRCLQFGHTKLSATSTDVRMHNMRFFSPAFMAGNYDIALISEPYIDSGEQVKSTFGIDTYQFFTSNKIKVCILAKPGCGSILGLSQYSTSNFYAIKITFGQTAHTHDTVINILEHDISTLNVDDLELIINELTNVIHSACRASMHVESRGTKPKAPWWTEELETLKQEVVDLHYQLHADKRQGMPLEHILETRKQKKGTIRQQDARGVD
ncbi:unnamed protein product [Parnassius apollo]|uniref:(apollo) hypothetical protein n=1 Tax=Parnassius apollo TaxID=110799 RepID=A0A8S3WH21_PARAO|nr:unnamed protein product [Parnassius apollo]